jgi:hypothetical protein
MLALDAPPEAAISDRLLHGDVGIGSSVTHKSTNAPINMFADIQVHAATDLAAKTHFFKLFVMGNAGLARFKRCNYLVTGITQA